MHETGAANTAVIITLVVYKLVLIAIGLMAARLNRSESDFFLGGRNLGPWVAGLSYAASTSSAWVLLGFTGFVYAYGLSALWMVPGIWLGYAGVWVWFGPKLRAESAAAAYVTPTDFLVARAGGWASAIRMLSGGLVLFMFVFYIAAQFGAAAIAFENQFGLGRAESVLIGAVVILIYGLIGGFWAVSLTDTLQAAMMLLIAVLIPVLAVIHAGGPSGIAATLSVQESAAYLDPTGGQVGFVFIGFALGVSAIGLGALGQPQLLSRLMAVRDDKVRRQGFWISMVWAIVLYIGMSALALSGRALMPDMANGEAMFYALAGTLLPAVLAGIVIAAVLSAVMSTVDSLLIAASAAAAHDMRLNTIIKGREVLISRLVMATICFIAVLLTLYLPATIFDRVLFSWVALGAAFGPVIVARVCNVEPTGPAIFLAIVLGFASTVVFYIFGQMGDPGTYEGITRLLTQIAQLPGDPGERVLPWVLPLAIVFLWRHRKESS